MPNWWMETALHDDYQAYVKRHGGWRPKNPSSKHIGIETALVGEWKDRWDVLGIFPIDVAGSAA